MPQPESKNEKKMTISQSKKTKKKSLKKKSHPKKKPPAHSTKSKDYFKKYVKQAVQDGPTPIPTHYAFIDHYSAKRITSFSSTSTSASKIIPSQTLKPIFTVVDDTQHLNSQNKTNLNDAALTAQRSSATPTPNTIPNTNQTMQIAGPIIGIFGGIALLAAFILLATRLKKRQQKEVCERQLKDDEDDENKTIIESTEKKVSNKDQKSSENDLQRFSVTDTLVGSASRPNSVCLKAVPQKRASQQGTRASWQSVSSSLDTISPTSTLIGTTTTSFMKTAERQLLQHERPSVLDHFDGQFKKNIETYRAQLADISNPLDRIDEQANDDI